MAGTGDGTLKGLAKGFRGRTLKTARMAGKVGLKALSRTVRPDRKGAESDKATAVASATALLGEMNELKGLTMKLGQMASYLEGAMPSEAQQVLAKLQHQSTAMAPEVIRPILESELGAPVEELFESFEPTPFAAASIGQVHRATFEGQEVAVKVQYPGIRQALSSDLSTLGAVAKLSMAVMPGRGKGLVDELRTRIEAECDYVQEAANQTLFAELLAPVSGASVPAVVPQRSALRVLTTVMSDAMPFDRFVETADQATKNRAAEVLFEACFRCIFQHAVFNADPHPGNYLFHPDGRVVFLDFGCVKHFEPSFIESWKALAQSVVEDDDARFREAFAATGMLGRPRGFDWDHQWEVMRYLYRPFLDPTFTYSHDYVTESYDLLLWKNPNKLRLAMPPEWLMLNRLQWGLNSVLAKLDAQGRFPALWKAAVYGPTTPAKQA